MDVSNRSAWERLGAGSGWTRRAWELGQQLRPASETAGQLFVVGTPTHDAWHVAAHLDDEATFTGLAWFAPPCAGGRPQTRPRICAWAWTSCAAAADVRCSSSPLIH